MNSREPVLDIKIETSEGLDIKQWKRACYRLSSGESKNSYPVGFLVNEYEEYALESLKDPSSQSGSIFYNTMKQISLQAKVNLYVIVGHSNMCFNYIQQLKQRIEKKEVEYNDKTVYPNVLLLIACFSEGYLDQLQPHLESYKFHIFGFENFVHVVNGEIYSCEEEHKKTPKLICDFPGAKENLNTMNKNSSLNNNIDKHALKQCCKSKFGAFSKLFIESLNERNCVKFPAEVFIKRFAYLSSPVSKWLSFYVFSAEDGIACTPEIPCSKPSEDLIELQKQSDEFNLKRGAVIHWEEIIRLLHEEDDFIAIDYAKRLKKDDMKALDMVLEDKPSKTLLEHAIVEGKYYFIVFLLTQKQYPINLFRKLTYYQDKRNVPGGDTYLGTLYIANGKYQSWQLFNLLYYFFKLDPALFTFTTESTQMLPSITATSRGFKPFILFYSIFIKKLDFTTQVGESITNPDYFNGLNLMEEFEQKNDRGIYFDKYTLLYFLVMGADPNTFGKTFNMYIDGYITSTLWKISLSEDILEKLTILFAFGFYNTPYIGRTMQSIDYYLSLNDIELKETLSLLIEKAKKERLDYRVITRGGERVADLTLFIENPREALQAKKKMLERLQEIKKDPELFTTKRNEYTKLYADWVDDQVTKLQYLKQIPARAESLNRLGLFQRFIGSKLAEKIPKEVKEEYLHELKKIIYPSRARPEVRILNDVIATLNEFSNSLQKYYAKAENIPMNRIAPIIKSPNLVNITMKGGRRYKKRFCKTRKQR